MGQQSSISKEAAELDKAVRQFQKSPSKATATALAAAAGEAESAAMRVSLWMRSQVSDYLTRSEIHRIA